MTALSSNIWCQPVHWAQKTSIGLCLPSDRGSGVFCGPNSPESSLAFLSIGFLLFHNWIEENSFWLVVEFSPKHSLEASWADSCVVNAEEDFSVQACVFCFESETKSSGRSIRNRAGEFGDQDADSPGLLQVLFWALALPTLVSGRGSLHQQLFTEHLIGTTSPCVKQNRVFSNLHPRCFASYLAYLKHQIGVVWMKT